ncbi:hypothetical protein CCO02nite_27030 [Cellulomonas composti]|uniref:Beta-xylanase n=1 Tax=Cellulomonas composti TaxID=266130 RepID=A0A511JDI9_9CELL|nr:hypothetical protein CCO02nite_27030 [Cellulomonas composti]
MPSETAASASPGGADEQSLAALGKAAGRDVGFAIDPVRLGDQEYARIAATQYDLVAAENVMKWETTEPDDGRFEFGPGDDVVRYAEATDKKVYGHNLVWHEALPAWVKSLDEDALRTAMEDHVRTQAAHWRGRVIAWDVVNEAFDDDGSRRGDSVFQQVLGDGYVEDAFRTARAADPDVDLCYNDYNLEWIGPKSDAVYAMVADFRARGVPIDCVGFQGHLPVGGVPGDLVENLERFAALGVDVRITELDVRVPTPASDGDLRRQADDFGAVFSACLEVERCRGVTTWGITDRYSWVPSVFPDEGAPLIWDAAYRPKPAFDAVVEALGAGRPTRQ